MLGLPASGSSSRQQLASSTSGPKPPHFASIPPTPLDTPGLTPAASGRTSPTHPIPTAPLQATKRLQMPIVLSNLIKSLIVFTLTGLIHDQSVYWMYKWYTFPGSPWLIETPQNSKGKWINDELKWTDAMVTTPFFVIQPLALAVEAIVKRQWRAWKLRRHPQWLLNSNKRRLDSGSNARTAAQVNDGADAVEPAWLVFVERLIGFVWTWVWLGWSARWFVTGFASIGHVQADQESVRSMEFGGKMGLG